MKKVFWLILVPMMMVTVSGCAGTSWAIKGKCSSGGDCELSGEVGGTFNAEGDDKIPMLKRLVASYSVPDAAALEIDVSGSNVQIPASGLVTIQLLDSSSGIVQAVGTFEWVKSGSKIRLANVNAVNSWALANGGSADSFKYDLHRFQTQGSQGVNTLQVAAQYEGVTKATSTTGWYRGRNNGCPDYANCEIR